MCESCDNLGRTPFDVEDFGENVKAGIAMLDERYPNWLDVIDLTNFDLSEPETCVLGQVAQANGSTYCDELARWGGFEDFHDFWHGVADKNLLVDLGTDLGFVARELDYPLATQVWHETIVALRLARKTVSDTSSLV